jgi:hypothetical protein
VGPSAALTPETFKVSVCSKTILPTHDVSGWRPPTPHAGRSPIYTDKRWRPFCRRALRTRRPPLVFILARKPCTRLRRRTLGCHVRFGIPIPLQSGLRLAIIPSFLTTCKFPGRHETRNRKSGLPALVRQMWSLSAAAQRSSDIDCPLSADLHFLASWGRITHKIRSQGKSSLVHGI